MMPTRRTQPYRAGARMPGPALDAMLLGRQPGMTNGADFNRLIQQRMRPGASADVRGLFGGNGGMAVDRWPGAQGLQPTMPMRPSGDRHEAALHELILAAMQMAHGNGGVAAPPTAHAAMTGDPRRRPLHIPIEAEYATTGPFRTFDVIGTGGRHRRRREGANLGRA